MKNIKTTYDHIRSNNIKTAMLVFMFPAFLILLVFLFTCLAQPVGYAIQTTIQVAIPTFIVCSVWMLISWAFGDSMILSMSGATEIHNTDKKYRDIFNSVENVALAAGLPTPRVYIINDNSMNAFATGRSPNDAAITLTTGIIKRLDNLELQGVIAHEMAHIGNRDIRLDMLIITGIGVTVFIADFVLRAALQTNHSNNDDKNATPAVLFAVWGAFMIFNIIITPLLHLAISRQREFTADATGAQITRNPHALASALRKISTDSRVESLDNIKSVSAICIAEPGKARMFFDELLSTHPKTSERIRRLESM